MWAFVFIHKQIYTHMYIVRHTWDIVESAGRKQAAGTDPEFYVCPSPICNSEETI